MTKPLLIRFTQPSDMALFLGYWTEIISGESAILDNSYAMLPGWSEATQELDFFERLAAFAAYYEGTPKYVARQGIDGKQARWLRYDFWKNGNNPCVYLSRQSFVSVQPYIVYIPLPMYNALIDINNKRDIRFV